MSVLSSGGRPARGVQQRARNNAGKATSDEAFIDAIYAMSSNLKDADEVTTELIELFFELAQTREALPADLDKETIDMFLTSLIAIIGFNAGQPLAYKALEILFKFIKNGKCDSLLDYMARISLSLRAILIHVTLAFICR